MTMKLNVGLSRKVGEANYGSRGASVHLEVEVESALAAEPQQLQERIRLLFRLARQSVDSELNGNGNGQGPGAKSQSARQWQRPPAGRGAHGHRQPGAGHPRHRQPSPEGTRTKRPNG